MKKLANDIISQGDEEDDDKYDDRRISPHFVGQPREEKWKTIDGVSPSPQSTVVTQLRETCWVEPSLNR